MRSIIKSTDSVENGTGVKGVKDEQSRGWNQGKKKNVRFDDMVLIGEDNNQIQLFLSDEEASIVEKKGTPTKLNLQSSAELRRRIRQQKYNASQENGHRAKAGGNKGTPKRQTPELSIDQVLEKKRKRTQTSHFINSFQRKEPNEGSTKQSSPGDNNSSSNSSPEKMVKTQDRRLEFDGSYDGDADDGAYRNGKSKLKNRRNIKKHRKDMQNEDSPVKGGDEILLQDEEADSGLFGQGRRETLPRAGFVNKHQS